MIDHSGASPHIASLSFEGVRGEVLLHALEEKGIYAYRFNIDLSKQETLPNAISENIAYAPSVAVFIEGDLIAFLDPTSDEDTAYYLSLEGFESWIAQYVR